MRDSVEKVDVLGWTPSTDVFSNLTVLSGVWAVAYFCEADVSVVPRVVTVAENDVASMAATGELPVFYVVVAKVLGGAAAATLD